MSKTVENLQSLMTYPGTTSFRNSNAPKSTRTKLLHSTTLSDRDSNDSDPTTAKLLHSSSLPYSKSNDSEPMSSKSSTAIRLQSSISDTRTLLSASVTADSSNPSASTTHLSVFPGHQSAFPTHQPISRPAQQNTSRHVRMKKKAPGKRTASKPTASSTHPSVSPAHQSANPSVQPDPYHPTTPLINNILKPTPNSNTAQSDFTLPHIDNFIILNAQGIDPSINSCSRWKIPYIIENHIENETTDEKFIPAISVCESWLKPHISDAQIQIPHYQIVRADRKQRKRGGALLFIHEDLPISCEATYDEFYCQAAICTIQTSKSIIALSTDPLIHHLKLSI